MANLREKPRLNIADDLARQLGVLRLKKIVKQKQPISLSLLGAIFVRKAEGEESQAVGYTLPNILRTVERFPDIFILRKYESNYQEITVSLAAADHEDSDSLFVLRGVLKLRDILKQKGCLKAKQLSTFFNQQSSMEERKILGRNPAALTETIQALPSIFRICGDFVSIKIEQPSCDVPKADRPVNISNATPSIYGSNNHDNAPPVSYASAVTARTTKDDEISRARRTGISKIRSHLTQVGTLTISEVFYFMETHGTDGEHQAVGRNLASIQATLVRLPNIFAVSGQLVDLVTQSSLVNGLDKIYRFVKAKECCEIVQISGFIGLQGTLEERQAVGKNPHTLKNTLKKFSNIFCFNGERVSLTYGYSQKVAFNGHPPTAPIEFEGIPSPSFTSPTFLINKRSRNESTGLDSGYEGSVILDQSNGVKSDQNSLNQSDREELRQDHEDVHSVNPANTSSMRMDGQPSFTMIDVANNNDPSFNNFKQECLDRCNEFDKPIVGVSLSEDQKWLAMSSCANNVYLLDLETCCTGASGNHGNGVLHVVKEVLQSCNILKIVYDCRLVASALHDRYGFKVSTVFDTMTAHELLTFNETASVAELCSKYTEVIPPNHWCASIGGLSGLKIADSGEHTSGIRLAATARVLVPHLYRRMIVRFADESRLKEVLRLCEQILHTCYR